MVARYIGGLRVQIQEIVNLFDSISVLAAHQRALQVEKQLSRRSGSRLSINTGSNTRGANHSTSGNSSGQRAPTNVAQASRTTSSRIRCFGCGETGHQQSDCKK